MPTLLLQHGKSLVLLAVAIDSADIVQILMRAGAGIHATAKVRNYN